jgi:multiple sugar transport system substrate-binding protein
VKKIVPILAALLLGTVACSSSKSNAQPTGPVEITFWHGQADSAATSIERLVAEFNRTHPGVKVKTDSGGATADTMLPKVTAGIASGTYPDIAYMYGSWGANIGRSPKVPDLKSYISDPKVGWNDYWPIAQETATVNGKVIGFPAVVDNLTVLYNKKLLAKAGLNPPGPDWTWDDFRTMARKLTNPATKTYGTTWAVSGGEETTWALWPMLWQNGGTILSSEGMQATFNSSAGVQALTLLQQMTVKDKSVYIDSSPGDKGQKLFESNRLGLFLAGPWLLADVQAAKIDYGIAMLPGSGGDHQTISGPDNWLVLDHGSPRIKASVEFLTWLNAPEQQITWMKDTGSLPTKQSITKLPGYQEFLKKYPGIDVITANLINAKQIRPATTKYPRISSYVANAISSVLVGKADPKAALDSAARQSDSILAVPGP